jgi:hypothetical protein
MGQEQRDAVDRRSFLQGAAATGICLAAPSALAAQEAEPKRPPLPPVPEDTDTLVTNLADALSRPRSKWSMPGLHPGVVAEVTVPGVMTDDGADETIVAAMLAASMKALTGAGSSQAAWMQFVGPEDRVGIKVNPVGAPVASTTHELTRVVIAALESAGVRRDRIVFVDHYQHQLEKWGYDQDRYPGIEAVTFQYTEGEGDAKVARGSDRLDQQTFFECDYVIPDEQNHLDSMINGGPRSYFPKALTSGVDKLINIPILKHHKGCFTTLGLKNLAFGLTSNCMRGHQFVSRYIAETCAFPPIRDKTVLTVLDGLRAQYDRGPGASPSHVWRADTLMVATDPVALDSIGFDIIAEKRLAEAVDTPEGIEEARTRFDFLVRAENLGLGVHRGRTIDRRRVVIG